MLLHAHGHDIMFDLVAKYPIDAMNWHDRVAGPSLRQALGRFAGMLVGGVNEWKTMLPGTPQAVEKEIRDAIEQTGGRRLMIGPGCVIPINTPVENLSAALEAVGAR